jgi:hypothetical protein
MNIFVIYEVRFEYDEDSDHYNSCGIQCLRNGYRSEQAAREACRQLNRSACADSDNDPWSYGPDDPFESMELDELRQASGINDLDDRNELKDHWGELSSETRQRLWELSEANENKFFEVEEIEVPDCQVREPAVAR